MAKIRYQLIRPLKPGPNDESPAPIILKIILACAAIAITISYYNWTPEPAVTTEPTIPTTELHPLHIDTHQSTLEPKARYDHFVYTTNCRMPAVNPFTKDVLEIYHKTAYKKCDAAKDLITVNYDYSTRRYSLHMNRPKIKCCYKPILRSGNRTEADNLYRVLPCSYFKQDFVLPQKVDAIITECRWQTGRLVLQQDAFSLVQVKPSTTNKAPKSTDRRPSVLLWGIDSLSRMNFQRTMPLMYEYFRDTNWFELQGYNKMGDNTFPNIMAVLTGMNSTRSHSVCRPNEVGGMDACPMLWKNYKWKGYKTAYAEDWSLYATFNHLFRGFRNPPTDYYARPFILAIDKELKKEYESGIPYCVGRRHYAEYVYDAAVLFSQVYHNESYFGMFWTNSFSHNNFALPSSMDNRLMDYMKALNQSGTFENSIIIFFSDHGMRFGELRNLYSGFLEERMPIMYIWLPAWLREKYPEFVENLQMNRNRLTSPYDIYATLRHILELDTPLEELPVPEGCPGCQSVLYEVDESRGCSDVGIEDHWCTCQDYRNVSVTDPKAVLISQQLIEATNNFLIASNLTGICETLTLSNILSVKRETKRGQARLDTYLVRYEAEPASIRFEASTKWDNATQRISISVPEISRLTIYSYLSECVNDAVQKKFCICPTQNDVN